MKLRPKAGSFDPKNILPTVYVDTVHRVHFRSAPLESYASNRFSKIIDATLKNEIEFPSPAARIAWSLIIFDGIVTRPELDKAIANIDLIYRWRNHYCLDWVNDDGRQQRRYISPFTQTALAAPRTKKFTLDSVLAELESILAKLGPHEVGAYTLTILLADAHAWLRENISDYIYAHVSGLVPMTSLPRSVLARAEAELALKADSIEREAGIRHEGFQLAIAAYLDQATGDRGGWLVAELTRICRRDRSKSNSADRKRMLDDCLALASYAGEASPISALILAWVIDLIESGTRRKRRLKAITPAKYVGAAANLLWVTFRGKVLEEMSSAQFNTIYTGLIAGLSSSQARTLASALSSWHFFISTWLDVAPLSASLHKWVSPASPKANVLWPHEIAIIRQWLVDTKGTDKRSHDQLRIAFEILCGTRIRSNELLNLRMQNLKTKDNVAYVEIATHSRDGGDKSEAARRRMEIADPEKVELIQGWLSSRAREGAFPRDYLFGDPHRADRKYRSGHLYVSLNQLFKAATGDPTIGTHALSHTYISFSWLATARAPQELDVNPFEERSAESGHESPHTGFSSYFHFPEELLREQLDKAIAAYLDRWPTVASHVALSHEGFRQARARLRRRDTRLGKGMIAMEYVQRAAPMLLVPNASDGVDLIAPKSPLREVGERRQTLANALDVLNDVQHGHSPQAIALRSNLSPTDAALFAECAANTLQQIGETPRKWRSSPGSGSQALLSLSMMLNLASGLRIDFSRTGQEKVSFLYAQLTGNADTEIAKCGIASWIACYEKGYLSLERPGLAADFIRLLDAAKMPRSRMVVRANWDLDQTTNAGIRAIFHTGVAATPEFESIRKRYGRPAAYLSITSLPLDINQSKPPGNAALGMTGINALMLAAAACNLFNARHPSNPDTPPERNEYA